MAQMVRYGIGEQDFKSLIERNCVYVDKTQYIDRLVNSGSKYFFLARPRRFGKSLFLSALRYFFEGQRELFKGLYIDSTDWKWEEYPVLRLDLNPERYAEQGKLDVVVKFLFSRWEEKYGITKIPDDLSTRFQNIIETAHAKTGKQVVILVDEYDKPLVGNLNDDENFEHYRAKLASLYANFKSSAEHIRMVFLTGVSCFSKLSVFSDLNNFNNISFDTSYSDVCGFTESEVKEYFNQGLINLGNSLKMDYEDIIKNLKLHYGGYKFASYGKEVYNVWSILNSLDKSKIRNYWGDSCNPLLGVETLDNCVDFDEMLDFYYRREDLEDINIQGQVYRSGCLTIKKYIREMKAYQIGIPNSEAKSCIESWLIKEVN